jgi:hypothetical protein
MHDRGELCSGRICRGQYRLAKIVIPKTGPAVEIPTTIFHEDAGLPESGLGRRIYTGDRRAALTVQSIPNVGNDSPALFLAKKRPLIRNGKIWYDRYNRSGNYMNCVLINYPAAEKRQWDGVVTRISHTLTN